MDVKIEVRKGSPLSGGRVKKPFVSIPNFNDSWWLGDEKGQIVFCSFTADGRSEVARAQINLRSTLGETYPTYTQPEFGATEIERLEVRADLRHQGLGRQVIAGLLVEFPRPCIALSLDEWSDQFWSSIGWTEHSHPNPRGAALFVQPD